MFATSVLRSPLLLDEHAHPTRSIHVPASRAFTPHAHAHSPPFAQAGSPSHSPAAAAGVGKGPAHWQVSSSPPAAAAAAFCGVTPLAAAAAVRMPSSPPPAVPYRSPGSSSGSGTSGLGASLLAQKLNHHHHSLMHSVSTYSPPAPLDRSPSNASDMSSSGLPPPSLQPTTMQRAASVPSSSGSTISMHSGFGSGGSSGAPSPCYLRDGSSPLSSLSSTAVAPPCPTSLWWGCEEDEHARSVLGAYAERLGLYTTPRPGCRAPIEFIGRVKRDRIDVARLHRVIEHYRARKAKKAQQQHPHLRRYGSASSNASTHGIYGTSPCLASSFSPGSSPCSSLGLHPGFANAPSPLQSLPALGSFATLDLVSVYSRDTLPLGVSFPLIRHVWVCCVWDELDGTFSSLVPIHTEFEVDEAQIAAAAQAGQHDDKADEEDESESQGKATLKLYARSLVGRQRRRSSVLTAQQQQQQQQRGSSVRGSPKRSPKGSPKGTPVLSPAHSRTNGSSSSLQYGLTASITSVTPGAAPATAAAGNWHPAMPQTTHQHHHLPPHPLQQNGLLRSSSLTHSPPSASSLSSPSSASAAAAAAAASMPLSTSYLYSLPVYSEDCKVSAYATFGSRVARDTGDTLAARRRAAAAAPCASAQDAAQLPSTHAGSQPVVGDHSLGYAGSANACIYTCMTAMGRKTGGGSCAGAGAGIGNGGADDTVGEASCVVNMELELQAMAAGLERLAAASVASLSSSAASSVATSSSSLSNLPSESEEAGGFVSEHDDVEAGEEDELFSDEDEDEHGAALDSIGEEARADKSRHRAATGAAASSLATPGAEQTGFAWNDADDGDAADEDEDLDDDLSSDANDSASDQEDSLTDDSDDDDAHAGGSGARTQSGSVAIKSKPSRGAQHRRSDDEDDDFSAMNSLASSACANSLSLAAGSLGNDLQEALAALNGGGGGKKKAPATKGKKAAATKGRK